MSWSSAEVRFVDREQIIRELRDAVTETRRRYPEIQRVFLSGSLVNGTWTADSDADLIIVVEKDFENFFESCRYQIYTDAIPVDSLVYSEREFKQLIADPKGFVAENVASALEL